MLKGPLGPRHDAPGPGQRRPEPRRDLLEPVRGDRFVDRSLPPGFLRVDYIITPVRQRGGGGSRGGGSRSSVAGPGVRCTYQTGTPGLSGARAAA